MPIVGGDYDQEALAKVLDHERDQPGRGEPLPRPLRRHARNRLRGGRRPRVQPRARVPGRRDQGRGRQRPHAARCKLAETLAAYERGEINVLINAQLLAEGWNSPRATVCMHLAPTASRRVYQQRIGRIMRIHPRKEAGVVVDFVDEAATHNDRTVTLHSLLDSDFYRPGARVTPAPRRRVQRRARRKLSPAPWLVPVTPDPRRRVAVITREWERVDPGRLADDEQLLWARIAGRQLRFDERQQFAEKLARASRECRETFLMSCAAENPNRRLRLSALGDRVAVPVDRASFDDLVTMVTSAPTWEKDRVQGVRVLLRAIGEGKVVAPDDIIERWTWRLARATRKLQDRRASADLPDAKRLLGALTNSRGHRHDENAARLVNVALEQPIHVGVALLASAEGYTPTAQQLIDRARERLGTIQEVANALADNLPAPKQPSSQARGAARSASPARLRQPSANGTAGAPATAPTAADEPAAKSRIRRGDAGRDACERRRNRSGLAGYACPRMLVLVGVAFVAGMVTAVSPCVLPVLPIVFAGGATGSPRRPYAVVAGLVVSFALFTLDGHRDPRTRSGSPTTCCAGSRSASSPSSGSRFCRPGSADSSSVRSGPWAAARPGDAGGGFLLGLSLGLLFTPCAGPVIAAIATVAATRSWSVEAVVVTLAYAMGAGRRPAGARDRGAARALARAAPLARAGRPGRARRPRRSARSC